MKIAIRTYYGKGHKKLFDLLEKHQAEVQTLMRAVEGLVSYSLARNSKGGFSVTVCQNKSGITKCIKTKRNFISKHAPDLSLDAMHIIEGSIITHMK